MPGRRGVHHHELFSRLANYARKSLKDGDFLGAGRAQILFEQRPALGVKRRAFGRHYLLAIALDFGVRIDAADREMVERAVQRFRQMGRRVGGGEMHREPTTGQFDSDGGGQGGFADAAFAHQHNQSAAVGGDAIDQFGKAGRFEFHRLAIIDDEAAPPFRSATGARPGRRRD